MSVGIVPRPNWDKTIFLLRVWSFIFIPQHCHVEGSPLGSLPALPHDIMGPFRFVPLMCCHRSSACGIRSQANSVSMERPITSITIWGISRGTKAALFLAATSDPVSISGRFPNTLSRRYLSGPDFLPGVIAVLSIFSKVIILATYCGARILSVKSGKISVKQNDLLLTAELLSDQGRPLHAPKRGEMCRTIREKRILPCPVPPVSGWTASLGGKSCQASFEYEYPC